MARKRALSKDLPLADESTTMPENIKEVIKSVSIDTTLPTNIQLMVDSGLSNKTILTNILELNGKTYSEFVKGKSAMMNKAFIDIVEAASNFK